MVSFSLAFNQLLYVSQGSTRETALVRDMVETDREELARVLGGRLGKSKPRRAGWNSWPWAEPFVHEQRFFCRETIGLSLD